MQPNLVLRDEIETDAAAIAEVTVAAFQTLAISNHTEQYIIEALRAAGALVVSLVAEQERTIIGHVAFSPVTISDGTPGWYGLGPLSVLPAYQRQGIGTALIHEGLSRLQKLHATGCCLVGHPEYYRRFGFTNPDALAVEGVPPEVFFVLPFGGPCPTGTVHFHPAFLADGPQQG